MPLLVLFGTTGALDVLALGGAQPVPFCISYLEGIRGYHQRIALFSSYILDCSMSSTPK